MLFRSAVHVAGWVAKFISGDLTLVQDVVKQANQLTGKVNNVEAKTDPTTGEVLAIAQQFDQDDRKAKKEYRKLQRKYNKLKASTTKIIAEKDDKIDTLSIEIRELKDMMRDLGIEFKGVRTELTDARVELKNSNQKLDQATDELVETKEELKNSNQKLDRATDALVETKDQLDETNNKLDRVLNERVDLGGVPPQKHEQLVILRAYGPGLTDDDYHLYVIRRQKLTMRRAIAEAKSKYPEHGFRKWLTIDHPNTKALWNNFRKEFPGFYYDQDSNLFDLPDNMEFQSFQQMVAYINTKRRELE